MDKQEREHYRAMESRYLRVLVLDNVERYPKNLATRIITQHKVTSYALYQEIQAMVKGGILIAEGKTSARTYCLADPVAARVLLSRLKPKAEKEWNAYWEGRRRLIEGR